MSTRNDAARAGSVSVVVVARDRWSQAPATLERLLGQLDAAVPVVVVDGAAPPSVRSAFDRLADTGRVRVVRRNRFLASNEARNLGADGLDTEWIAFVENDVTISDGWLDRLLQVGTERQAASVYPAYLDGPEGVTVHGLGAELTLTGPPGAQRLIEYQPHAGKRWSDVAADLVPVERIQSEPHIVLVRRSFVEEMGGFDEGLLSWFDHVDLALHHRRLGATAWLVPDVVSIYHAPPPVVRADIGTFVLRWSRSWFGASLEHLCAAWGLDPTDDGWGQHEWYRRTVRSGVPTRWSPLNRALSGLSVPYGRAVARRWARQAAAEVG
jgi:GT2 family glycosyltransferase